MKKFIKRIAIIVGVAVTTTLCFFIISAKMEAIKAKKLINEFHEEIQRKGTVARESVKLHIGDFIVFKANGHFFSLKIMELKTSGFEYYETYFDCYVQDISVNEGFDSSSKYTHGKARKINYKRDGGYYEGTSNPDRFIECGNILFDWSPSDEHDYAWLAIEKIISGPPTLEYSLTNIKDLSKLNLKSPSLKWIKK